MQYINITNWKQFQHYKDRRPSWVKLYIEIIEEFDKDGFPKKFYTLSDTAKLTFIMLVCLRANYNKQIPYPNDKWLIEKLGIQEIDLNSLADTGFITIEKESVSKPYQNRITSVSEPYQDRTGPLPPEREREKEKEREDTTTTTHVRDIVDLWSTFSDKPADLDSDVNLEATVVRVAGEFGAVTVDQLLEAMGNYQTALELPNSQAWSHTLATWLQREHYRKYLPGTFNIDNYDKSKFQRHTGKDSVEQRREANREEVKRKLEKI